MLSFLHKYAKNYIFSQNGEEGILLECIHRMDLCYGHAVEIGGNDVKLAHRYLAGIYLEKGENVEAVKQLELYLQVSPGSKETDQIKNLIKELNKKAGRE